MYLCPMGITHWQTINQLVNPLCIAIFCAGNTETGSNKEVVTEQLKIIDDCTDLIVIICFQAFQPSAAGKAGGIFREDAVCTEAGIDAACRKGMSAARQCLLKVLHGLAQQGQNQLCIKLGIPQDFLDQLDGFFLVGRKHRAAHRNHWNCCGRITIRSVRDRCKGQRSDPCMHKFLQLGNTVMTGWQLAKQGCQEASFRKKLFPNAGNVEVQVEIDNAGRFFRIYQHRHIPIACFLKVVRPRFLFHIIQSEFWQRGFVFFTVWCSLPGFQCFGGFHHRIDIFPALFCIGEFFLLCFHTGFASLSVSHGNHGLQSAIIRKEFIQQLLKVTGTCFLTQLLIQGSDIEIQGRITAIQPAFHGVLGIHDTAWFLFFTIVELHLVQ